MPPKKASATGAATLQPLDPNVTVSLESKSASIDASVSDEAIKAAIAEAGYQVVGIE